MAVSQAGLRAIPGALPNFRNGKGTCLLTPRGGFFDARNQNRDLEPSVKTFQDSDRRGPPNSRGMDVREGGEQPSRFPS